MAERTVARWAGLPAAPTAEPVVPELLTSQDDGQAPGQQSGRSVLSRLVAVSRDEFAEDYWGHRALLSTAAELNEPYGDLLDASAVDELLSGRGLRTPFLRVAKAGNTVGDRAFTGSGGVGATIADQVSDDKLVRLFADGSTLVLQALHRVWPPVLALCQQLAAELGHPVQANAYVTPPQNQGFGHHYDVHDVFVLQIEGEKRWIIHSPVLESPLRDQPWNDHRAAVEQRASEPPLLETVLRPGDCLYLPRGFLHAAQALGGVSTHLTLGVHTWTGYHLAEQLVGQALRDLAQQPTVRRSLPLGRSFLNGSDVRGDIEEVRAALLQAVTELEPDRVIAAMQEPVRSSSRPAPVGPLQQVRDAEALTPDSLVTLRDHVAASLDCLGSGSVLRSRAGTLGLGEDEVAPVKTLLAGGSLPAGDLGTDLARRMLLAGVAVLA